MAHPLVAQADEPINDYVGSYLSQLEKGGQPVFYAACTHRSSAVVLIFSGSKEGLLIELSAGTPSNTALVVQTEKGLTLKETNGGVASYMRVQGLIDQMAKLSFHYVMPGTISNLLEIKPISLCKRGSRS